MTRNMLHCLDVVLVDYCCGTCMLSTFPAAIVWNSDRVTCAWLRATQFFETAGLIAIGVAAVFLFLSIFGQSLRDKKIITIINALACFGACGAIIIGAIIYGSQNGVVDYLSWAFALCIVGAIMEGVAGALLIVGTFATTRT
ncbi:uncharacterized protein [Haliotis asinina]|uniref:uncharacterized protein isoform X1 n=1 Tax=Haliotis asinina TaxID=109174 RepID=UPI003531E42D